MRQTVLTTLVFVMIASTAVCDEPLDPLKITLEGYKSPRAERYIVGELIPLRVTVENSADSPLKLTGLPLEGRSTKIHIEGDVREDCKLEQLQSLGYLTPSTLEPHQDVVKRWEAGGFGVLDVGEYEIWIEYDASAESDNYLEREGIPRIRVESNHLRFEIVAPVGIDATALQKLANPCNQMFHSTDNRERIIDEFPTSSYAGWALMGRLVVQDAERMVEILRQKKAHPPVYNDPPADKRVAEARAGLKRVAQEHLEQMTTYLQNRPDFADADWMSFRIAHLCLELGDTGRANTILKQLVRVKDLPTWLRYRIDALHVYAKNTRAPTVSSGQERNVQ